MTFRQFAINNVKRNARAYFAYFLSSTFSVMTFFVYLMFWFHPDIVKSPLGDLTKWGMQAAAWITFLFSFLFIFYSIYAFIRSRLKEFALLLMLGITRRQLMRLLIIENMLIGSIATILGILIGLLFAKFFLLLGSNVMEMDPLPFYLPWKAIGISLLAFLILFFFLGFITVFLIRQKTALALLRGQKEARLEPRSSIFLVLLSIGCFAVAYWQLQQEMTQERMMLILLFNMIGTYYFFRQVSLFIIHLLKKRRFYWKGLRLLWVTELAYKLKDNARMFFLITIVSTIACVAAGTIFAVHLKNAKTYYDEAFDFQYHPLVQSNQWEDPMIDQTLEKEGISYQKEEIKQFWVFDFKEFDHVTVLPVSEFQRIAQMLSIQPPTLKPNEAYYVYAHAVKNPKKRGDRVTLQSNDRTLTVKGTLAKKLISNELLVVHDQTYKWLRNIYRDIPIKSIVVYHVPDWSNSILPVRTSKEQTISQQLIELNQEKLQQRGKVGWVYSRAYEYLTLKQSAQMMMFIGFFIAAIFSVFTASFLYFRLFTDLARDQRFFQTVSKIGLSIRQVKKISTIQIATLFYFPVFVTIIQTWFALEFVSEYIHLKEMLVPSFTVFCIFCLLQTIYFLVIRSRYLRQLQQAMV